MILDEPTNDLDIETLDLLQEMLAEFDGTVLIVSHDRDFIDRVATSTIALDGAGRAIEYPGGYSDYLRQRQTTSAEAKAAKPISKAKKTRQNKDSLRLGYRQRRALVELPRAIAALEVEISELESELGDGELYARSALKFDAKAARLTAAKAELGGAEDAWLELEVLRESLEGNE